jgi:FKBP-type peptidyl-prolyl cis-trans isomerase FkpA
MNRQFMKIKLLQKLCAPLVVLALFSGTSTAQTAPKPAEPADPLAAAAAEKGAVVTASGLVYLATKEGSGTSPSASDTVNVHYRGTFTNGREFDSSYKRGAPLSFPLNRVIPCWTEGLQKMKVGGKAKLTCPSAIAYGERGAGGGSIPPNSILQFEVELLGIGGR